MRQQKSLKMFFYDCQAVKKQSKWNETAAGQGGKPVQSGSGQTEQTSWEEAGQGTSSQGNYDTWGSQQNQTSKSGIGNQKHGWVLENCVSMFYWYLV